MFINFNFMKKSKIIAALLICIFTLGISEFTAEAKKKEEKAKYIFLFIGDGMGCTHVSAAESYLSYKEGNLGGAMLTMTQFPYFGTATTYSANRYVTDSSAAGTAIASGEKTNNGMLGVDPDGNPVKSFAYDLKEDGYQIGIISTVGINHATPGSFYGHDYSRNSYYEISKQIPESGFEFFAGDGFIEFQGKSRTEEPVDAYIERNGYIVAYGIDEFRKEAEGKKYAVFCQESNRSESAGNYVSEGKTKEDATLSQMLELGIDFLDEDEPFFFMCEGGKIDWTAHDHRTMPMVMDILEMDAAIATAYEFYKKYPKETLIVVTADHETGGLTLGCGPDMINWKRLEDHWLSEGKKNTLPKEENEKMNRECSIGWTTGGHTGGAVPVFAVGKGAEKFMGRMDNTDIKGKILGE